MLEFDYVVCEDIRRSEKKSNSRRRYNCGNYIELKKTLGEYKMGKGISQPEYRNFLQGSMKSVMKELVHRCHWHGAERVNQKRERYGLINDVEELKIIGMYYREDIGGRTSN